VGDTEPDGGGEEAMNMRENGMFLCSNKITLPHPTLEEIPEEEGDKPYIWSLDEDGKVRLSEATAAFCPPQITNTLLLVASLCSSPHRIAPRFIAGLAFS